jgi:DNA-binding NarL/FixJ family response regulator
MDRQSLHRIVLIDDSQMARLGLRDELSRTAEFRIIGEADTAAEGLELVEKLNPDLVLLNHSLPDVSGVQACRLIMAARPETRVLMLSVYDDPALIRAAIAAGAQGYVLKDTPVVRWWNVMWRVAGKAAVLPTQLLGMVIEEVRDMGNGLSSDSMAELSPQELRLLPLIAKGLTNKEIAFAVALSEKTVKNYISNMFSKLGISRRSQVVTLYARSLANRSLSVGDCA